MKNKDKDIESLCDMLKDYRIENGYTQKEIADYLKVDRSTYAKYENGRKPKIDVFISLAELYNISVTEMLADYYPEERGVDRNIKARSPRMDDDRLERLSADEQRLLAYYRCIEAKSSVVEFARKTLSDELTVKTDEEESED